MARYSPGVFGRWASEIDRPRRESPWQNAYAERLIGSIRRECIDQVVVGRYVCNTFDEALANSDPAYRANARQIRQSQPISARRRLEWSG